MRNLYFAIERYEQALRACATYDGGPDTPGSELDAAEAELLKALNASPPDIEYEGGSEFTQGCTQGYVFRGSVYAPGIKLDGKPGVILMRGLFDAETFEPIDLERPAPLHPVPTTFPED